MRNILEIKVINSKRAYFRFNVKLCGVVIPELVISANDPDNRFNDSMSCSCVWGVPKHTTCKNVFHAYLLILKESSLALI